jgi:hypothetical protein
MCERADCTGQLQRHISLDGQWWYSSRKGPMLNHGGILSSSTRFIRHEIIVNGRLLFSLVDDMVSLQSQHGDGSRGGDNASSSGSCSDSPTEGSVQIQAINFSHATANISDDNPNPWQDTFWQSS